MEATEHIQPVISEFVILGFWKNLLALYFVLVIDGLDAEFYTQKICKYDFPWLIPKKLRL